MNTNNTGNTGAGFSRKMSGAGFDKKKISSSAIVMAKAIDGAITSKIEAGTRDFSVVLGKEIPFKVIEGKLYACDSNNRKPISSVEQLAKKWAGDIERLESIAGPLCNYTDDKDATALFSMINELKPEKINYSDLYEIGLAAIGAVNTIARTDSVKTSVDGVKIMSDSHRKLIHVLEEIGISVQTAMSTDHESTAAYIPMVPRVVCDLAAKMEIQAKGDDGRDADLADYGLPG